MEHEFAETSRYVSFEKSNTTTFSREFLKLLQAICSEIDVVGKEIAVAEDPLFSLKGNITIKHWGYALQKHFQLKNYSACFLDDFSIEPWKIGSTKKEKARMVQLIWPLRIIKRP